MHELDFLNDISESSILILEDEELLSLWEDAHERRIGGAKGYNLQHYNTDDKIKKNMILSHQDLNQGKSKRSERRAKAKMKNQHVFLGLHDNSYDVEKESNKAASFRQNLNDIKQERRLFKNSKMDRNKKILSDQEARDKTNFHNLAGGGAMPYKNSFYLTTNAAKRGKNVLQGVFSHEENHLNDFDHVKKTYGRKAADKLADAGVLATNNYSKAIENRNKVDKDTKDDPYSSKNYALRRSAEAKVAKAKKEYYKNPTEYNSKGIEAAMRKGVLFGTNPNKVRNFRIQNLKNFVKKGKTVPYFNWDKHYPN